MSKLYSVSTQVTITLVTLVRAETSADAVEKARERKVETAWRGTVAGEGALTHWILNDVPGYARSEHELRARVI